MLTMMGSTAISTNAFALEGLELFQEMLSKGKATVTWEAVEESASDSFTLTNVKIADPNNRITTVNKFDVQGLTDEGPDRIKFNSIINWLKIFGW